MLYGQTDIAGYKPAPGDLAYPEKLEMMKTIELATRKEDEEKAEKEEGGKDYTERNSAALIGRRSEEALFQLLNGKIHPQRVRVQRRFRPSTCTAYGIRQFDAQ